MEKTICTHSNSFDRLQAEIIKICNANKELESQIKKMKNCFNCAKGDWDNRVKCIKSGCVNRDKWKMKEND